MSELGLDLQVSSLGDSQSTGWMRARSPKNPNQMVIIWPAAVAQLLALTIKIRKMRRLQPLELCCPLKIPPILSSLKPAGRFCLPPTLSFLSGRLAVLSVCSVPTLWWSCVSTCVCVSMAPVQERSQAFMNLHTPWHPSP